MFFAVLARTLGIENPVLFVRENYFPHAVETMEQDSYVYDLDVSKAALACEVMRLQKYQRPFSTIKPLKIAGELVTF